MTPPSKKKILVIDDDPVLLRLLESHLSEKGFEPVAAHEADRGLQLAMSISPSLIILDVMMPIINGYNICRLLKNESAFKHIPIMLLTGRDNDEDMRIGEEAGADAYLTKPVDIPLLFTQVHTLTA